MKERLDAIKENALSQIKATDSLDKLNDIRVAFLGKKGELTEVLKGMKEVAPEDRPKVGQIVNETRQAIEEVLEAAKKELAAKKRELQMKAEVIDVTLPAKKAELGHKHPNMLARAGLKVSLLIGIVISTLHFFQKVLPTALDPLHFYKTGNLETVANVNNMWMAMGEGWHYTLYVRLIPLLAVVPYAVTYYTDYKKGIVKNYYTRTKKINYISAKYIAVFLTGGTAAVAPLVLDLIATSAVMPSFIAISHTVPCNGNGIWSYILFSHPYIYYLLYFILQFICAGLMATMSLVVSLYVNNAFIVLLFPSVLCEFINAVSTWIPVKYRYIKGAAPWRLFRIDQVAINYWQSYVIFICVVLLFDLVIYVWRGVKNDAL